MTITSEISTVSYLATRPTSLRPRSTSITCSARSFGSASSSSASRWSSSSVAPRRRGAGRGGAGPLPSPPPAPQRAIDLERIDGERHGQPLTDHNLKDIAGADVLDALANGLLESALGE